jgi:hypothetical protein
MTYTCTYEIIEIELMNKSEPIVSDNILEMIVNDKRLYYDKFKN